MSPSATRSMSAVSSSGMPATGERRKTTRYPCWLYSLCRPLAGSNASFFEAIVLNLSTGGLKLLLQRPYEDGTLLAVQLEGFASESGQLLLMRVVHASEESDGKWLVGCVLDRTLAEETVYALLMDAAETRPPLEVFPWRPGSTHEIDWGFLPLGSNR